MSREGTRPPAIEWDERRGIYQARPAPHVTATLAPTAAGWWWSLTWSAEKDAEGAVLAPARSRSGNAASRAEAERAAFDALGRGRPMMWEARP